MPRVVHFDINADDPDRAVRFYKEVFGWKIEKWEGPVDYWLVTTGHDDQPGINGGIMKRMNPQATILNTIDVPSVDDYARRIEELGGKIVVPKMAVPGVGWLIYCADTEANVFGIMEDDPTAE